MIPVQHWTIQTHSVFITKPFSGVTPVKLVPESKLFGMLVAVFFQARCPLSPNQQFQTTGGIVAFIINKYVQYTSIQSVNSPKTSKNTKTNVARW